jgi:hypothetical protein
MESMLDKQKLQLGVWLAEELKERGSIDRDTGILVALIEIREAIEANTA